MAATEESVSEAIKINGSPTYSISSQQHSSNESGYASDSSRFSTTPASGKFMIEAAALFPNGQAGNKKILNEKELTKSSIFTIHGSHHDDLAGKNICTGEIPMSHGIAPATEPVGVVLPNRHITSTPLTHRPRLCLPDAHASSTSRKYNTVKYPGSPFTGLVRYPCRPELHLRLQLQNEETGCSQSVSYSSDYFSSSSSNSLHHDNTVASQSPSAEKSSNFTCPAFVGSLQSWSSTSLIPDISSSSDDSSLSLSLHRQLTSCFSLDGQQTMSSILTGPKTQNVASAEFRKQKLLPVTLSPATDTLLNTNISSNKLNICSTQTSDPSQQCLIRNEYTNKYYKSPEKPSLFVKTFSFSSPTLSLLKPNNFYASENCKHCSTVHYSTAWPKTNSSSSSSIHYLASEGQYKSISSAASKLRSSLDVCPLQLRSLCKDSTLLSNSDGPSPQKFLSTPDLKAECSCLIKNVYNYKYLYDCVESKCYCSGKKSLGNSVILSCPDSKELLSKVCNQSKDQRSLRNTKELTIDSVRRTLCMSDIAINKIETSTQFKRNDNLNIEKQDDSSHKGETAFNDSLSNAQSTMVTKSSNLYKLAPEVNYENKSDDNLDPVTCKYSQTLPPSSDATQILPCIYNTPEQDNYSNSKNLASVSREVSLPCVSTTYKQVIPTKPMDPALCSMASCSNVWHQWRSIFSLLLEDAPYLMLQVLRKLPEQDLLAVSQVNRQLRQLVLGTRQLRTKLDNYKLSAAAAMHMVGKENLITQSKVYGECNTMAGRRAFGPVNGPRPHTTTNIFIPGVTVMARVTKHNVGDTVAQTTPLLHCNAKHNTRDTLRHCNNDRRDHNSTDTVVMQAPVKPFIGDTMVHVLRTSNNGDNVTAIASNVRANQCVSDEVYPNKQPAADAFNNDFKRHENDLKLVCHKKDHPAGHKEPIIDKQRTSASKDKHDNKHCKIVANDNNDVNKCKENTVENKALNMRTAVQDTTTVVALPKHTVSRKRLETRCSPRKIIDALQSAVSSIQAAVSPSKHPATLAFNHERLSGTKKFCKKLFCNNENSLSTEPALTANNTRNLNNNNNSIVNKKSDTRVAITCRPTAATDTLVTTMPRLVKSGAAAAVASGRKSEEGGKQQRRCLTAGFYTVIDDSPTKFSPIKLFSKSTKKRLRRL